jgi:hypothetical protein
MNKSPGVQSKPNLLPSDSMHCNGNHRVILDIVRNHHKLQIMPANRHMSFGLGIKVSFAGMADDVLDLLQFEAPECGSVLEVVRPIDHRLSNFTMSAC